MKRLHFASIVVTVQLAVMRFGAMNLLASVLLAASLAGWLWGIPHLRAEAITQQRTVDRAQKQLQAADVPPVVAQSVAEQRLIQFYDTLGDARFAEQQVKTLFAIASKNGLTLTQAEYKSAVNQAGQLSTYQILLPVKAPYPAIRAFCEQTLRAIPFASLDEIRFKRETIASKTLEAQLRFTLYLTDPGALRPAAPLATTVTP